MTTFTPLDDSSPQISAAGRYGRSVVSVVATAAPSSVKIIQQLHVDHHDSLEIRKNSECVDGLDGPPKIIKMLLTSENGLIQLLQEKNNSSEPSGM